MKGQGPCVQGPYHAFSNDADAPSGYATTAASCGWSTETQIYPWLRAEQHVSLTHCCSNLRLPRALRARPTGLCSARAWRRCRG